MGEAFFFADTILGEEAKTKKGRKGKKERVF
jgi:hypothetical protein